MRSATTRSQIVEAADRLFYENGFDATSFADIAKKVRISRGNFYHHFRTKDAILDAVIDQRIARTREMLEAWERESADPATRICCFIKDLRVNREKIFSYGCPVGTLSTELSKLRHPGHGKANLIFALIRDWLRNQFRTMGADLARADALAMKVLSWRQGGAAMATAFHDRRYVQTEVERMCAWIADRRAEFSGADQRR